MADDIVTGTWITHLPRGSELIIDVPPATDGPVRDTDSDQIGPELVSGPERGPFLRQPIQVTIRFPDGTSGEYSGTVYLAGQRSSLPPNPSLSMSPARPFRYKRFGS